MLIGRRIVVLALVVGCGGSPAARDPVEPTRAAAGETSAPGDAEAAPRGPRAGIRTLDGSELVFAGEYRGYPTYTAPGEVEILGFVFPVSLGPYQREEFVDYKSAAGGYSAGYRGPAGEYMTLYVYGDGADPEGALRGAADAIMSQHAGVEEVASGPFTIEVAEGGEAKTSVTLFWLRLKVEIEGRRAIADTIVTSFRGHYVKARVTMPAADADADLADTPPPVALLVPVLGIVE